MSVAAQGTHLTIQIEVREANSVVTLSSPRAKTEKFNSRLQRAQLDTVRGKMRDGLRGFAEAVERSFRLQGSRQWQQIDEAMQLLRTLGTELGARVFNYGDVQRVEQYCRDACFWDKRLTQPPRIELLVENHSLAPFECIPLFQRKPAGKITGPQDLEREARSYAGFVGIIQRTIVPEPRSHARLTGRNQLRAKVFQYASLEAVTRVTGALQKHGASLASTFPQRLLAQQDFEESMLRFFRKGTEQVFYFGCHCSTTDADAMQHRFKLLDAKGSQERRLFLGTLDKHFYQEGERTSVGPLIFMNACGGASVLPAGSTSFPETFLNANFAGYIGTESIIPDTTAATFASIFFKNFLTGSRLGQALFSARRHLLNRGDPLGILYTAYASSDMLAMIQNSKGG
jgi:CHAT domain